MRTTHWRIGLVLAVIASSVMIVLSVQAGPCDGTTGDDTVVCEGDLTSNSPDNAQQVNGDLGNDTIINNGTVTFVEGDGQGGASDVKGAGDGGDDVIVNEGIVTVEVLGDYATGDGGDDNITNNFIVIGFIVGDSVDGVGGDDTIINNGLVGGSIVGDFDNGTGGDDVIINNGIVLGSIIADDLPNVGGDDLIVNGGIVLGNIYAGGGDDVIELGNESIVFGIIDGEAGYDVLLVDTSSANIDDAGNAFIIDNGNGTFTLVANGWAYLFTNIEEVLAFFELLSSCNQWPIQVFRRDNNTYEVFTWVRGQSTSTLIGTVDPAELSQDAGGNRIQDVNSQGYYLMVYWNAGQGQWQVNAYYPDSTLATDRCLIPPTN
jgi:hypothetical protein